MRIFRSTSTNPFLNLSFENYLFKTLPEHTHRLFLYVNDPCVVIGRNQNPWRECNVPLLRQLAVPLVRRRSGGGTVVHDRGNVNFCAMTPRDEFTRDRHAQMIVDKLNTLPRTVQRAVRREIDQPNSTPEFAMDSDSYGDEIPVTVNGPQVKLKLNERYDIVTKDNKKVSGSAYKIERQRAYHHGTMLLDSRLDVLSALLHRNVQVLGTVEGRGVESVKSPVANIGCDSEVFISSTIDAFRELYGYADDQVATVTEDDMPQQVVQEAAEMQTWEWAYSHTPDFTHTLTHPEHDFQIQFHVSKGKVTQAPPNYHELIGKEYKAENMPESWIADAL